MSMLILRRWKCANPKRISTPQPGKYQTHNAFTLIELLVVISIITFLISMLLPSLGKAREQAKAVACAAKLRYFVTGMATYAADNGDWIPGVNTSSVGMRASRLLGPDILQNSHMPVQQFDWMTPIAGQETSLPYKRADRFRFLLEHFRCPSLPDVPSVPVPYSTTADADAFQSEELWPTVSYLMPVYFQYFGDKDAGRVLAKQRGGGIFSSNYKVKALAPPENYTTVRVDRYLPRIDRIGPPSEKIMAAEGTRYLDGSLRLDFDVAPFPDHFGSFTTSGAWWRGSTAYGVAPDSPNWDDKPNGVGSPSKGQNLQLSYRHDARGRTNGHAQTNPGMMNAVFFDGHVEKLTDRKSRDIDYWYPTGAVIHNREEGMTDVPEDYRIR